MFPKKFQDYFSTAVGEVPIISVPARTFPLEIHYEPIGSDRNRDRLDAVVDRILDIHHQQALGHILVFLSGEGEIRHIEEMLLECLNKNETVVLPLFARLTREEQEKIFDNFGQKRKIILATNIAETSITIPGVRYVVDHGLAKIPNYSSRSGITALREQPISQASAQQRAGRAGRTGPGIVWRLYSETSLAKRPEYTSEEILRSDLAEVVLRLIDLGISEVESFAFPTPPPVGKVRAAVQTLELLGAIDAKRQLTDLGQRMVPFPLSPAMARMVIEAVERFPAVVDDVLVVGAFLSSRSPFVFPENEEERARRMHRRFYHYLGDLVVQVRVYRAWQKSQNQEQFCKQYFLDPEVMAFAAKAHKQLKEIAETQGIVVQGGGSEEDIVRAVAAGLPDRIIRRQGASYETLSGIRVALHPSSVLAGETPAWAVAAELVEYTRTYAINVSVVKREWLSFIQRQGTQRLSFQARTKATALKALAIPSQIQLGPLDLKVDETRGRPMVDITLEQVRMLKGLSSSDLPAVAKKIRGRVYWTGKWNFADIPLSKLVELARLGAFPKPAQKPIKAPTMGVLWETDRNHHQLENALTWVLKPVVLGKRVGWVALVANGAGGYWLELMPYFHDATQASRISAETLHHELFDGDPLRDQVDRLLQSIPEIKGEGK